MSHRVGAAGVLALLLAGIVSDAWAAHQYFRHYAGADGLSQAVVLAIHQDRAGYLWVGTQAGLNRYDGASLTIFSIREGLANDWINAIAEDRRGRLWLATLGGVSAWDGHRFQNYTTSDGLVDNRVVSLAIGPDDAVWAATSLGLCRYDGQRWRTYGTAEGLPATSVNAVLVDHARRLWAATSRGLAHLSADRFVPFGSEELGGKAILTLAEDRQRQLWLGLDDGLRVYRNDQLVKVYTRADGLTSLPPAALTIDRHGVVWVGTPGGLGSVRDGRFTLLDGRNGLKYNDVRCIFEDREGVLWIGVLGGLYKFQGRAFTNFGTADGLGSDNVRPILRDRRGRLWVGTIAGLSRFDGQRFETFTAQDGLSDSYILSLFEDRDGALWIGTRAGLTVFDGRRFVKDRSLTPEGRVVAIAQEPDGTIWCTMQPGGLFKRVRGRFVPVAVDGQTFSNARLLIDPRGRVWVSGDRGLSQWDGRTWRTYTTKDGLAANQPYHLCNDQKGRIWFGYHSSHGFSSFDGTRFTNYTTAEGLFNDAVYSLGVDRQDNLWIGTARGVDRYDGRRFTQFGTEEGYANDESNAGGFFADSDGTLWFGTMGGLSHFHPQLDLTKGPAPQIALADISLGQQEFSITDSPTVGHAMNELTARVVCLSFANEKRKSVEYRLLGHGDAWLRLRGPDLLVTRLSPGAYVLEVRARTYQGPWSDVSRFAFAVNAPVWVTWWFWLVTTTCVVSLLYAGYSLQDRRARRAAEKLEGKVADRTRELAQKTDELESFIYTVSHDLKAPVVSLQGLASLLKLDLAGQLNGDTALYLERIHANTVHMQRLIHDLLALSRIGRIKEARLRVNMAELAVEAAHELQGQIKLKGATVHVPESLPTVTCERDRLKQVWINLIANAITYARPDVPPVVQIGAKVGPENACAFFVRDNGLGVAREYHDKVFEIFYRVNGSYADSQSTGVGLAIVRRIVESHHGRAWVESEGLGQGSTFWFTLPHNGGHDVGENTGMPT